MDFLSFSLILSGYLLILTAGCLIADYIFPRIKPLERFIDRLPLASGQEYTETQEKPTEGKETGRKAA